MLQFLQNAAALLSTIPTSALYVTGVGIIETVLRLLPTQQPVSLLIVAAQLTHAAADVLTSLCKILDGVVPQNTTSK